MFLALAMSPLSAAWAVGFGDAKVESFLNQPFRASIDLLGADEARNLSVDLAGPARYQRMDIRPPANLGDYSASLNRVGGQFVVQVQSRQPVTDLVVDLVLVLTADGSQQVRHYPLLIDFAPQLDTAASAAPQSRPEPPVTAPVRQRPTVQAVSSGTSYGPVQRGQTLSGIVDQIAGDQGINGYQMMQAIVALNPRAFIDGDMNRMRAGVTLEIPEMAGFVPGASAPVASVPAASRPVATPTPAATTSAANTAPITRLGEQVSPLPTPPRDPTRRAPTPADPRLELVGTPTSGEILNSLNQWLENDDTELGLRAQSARRDLAYAAAEIETYRKENQLLRNRVGELEERLNTLRRLVALKAAEEAGEPPPPEVQVTPPATASATTVTPPAQAEVQPESAAPVGVESELASAVVSEEDSEASGPRWWPWALAVLLLLGVTLVVWYRGRMEDRARAQRTADLVHRIQSAGERSTGEL